MGNQKMDPSVHIHSEEQIEKTVEAIIATYDKNLRFFAYRFVQDWELVNDIMQEVYLKVFKYINILMNISAIKSWLYSITANQCKDYLRTKYYRMTMLTDDFEDIFHKTNLVEVEVLKRWDDRQIEQVIISLPKLYREPLILRYFHHHNYVEISEKLNISIQCVKTRLNRAKKMLRNKYLIEKDIWHEYF